MATVVRVILLVVMAGFAVVGAYMAAGSGHLDSGQSWSRWHLDIVREQLADLKFHLADYMQTHGRYPTNDEGLVALDNWPSRFVARVWVPRDSPSEREIARVIGQISADQFGHSRPPDVARFRARCGRVPASAEDLADIVPRLYFARYSPGVADKALDVDLAVGKADDLFILSPAGVLSPWVLPYVYENRTGLDPAVFVDSPANRDPEGLFSVRVDEGIYVYSVAAELLAREVTAAQRRYDRSRLTGLAYLGIAAVIGILAVFAFRRRVWALVAGPLIFLAPAGLGLVASVSLPVMTRFLVTCYAMGPLFSEHSPLAVSRQKELLEKYRGAGVITQETYQKAMSAVAEAEKARD